MQNSVMPVADADEFGLIDLLIPIVDNIKLLIVVPLLVALCAWVYTISQPLVYESTSWLRLPTKSTNNPRSLQDFSAQQNAMYESALQEFTSSDVLEIFKELPEVGNVNNAKNLDGETEYSQLRNQITTVFDKKAVLLKLTTRAHQADTAQILNQKLVEAYIKFTLPKGNELEYLNAQILLTQTSIKLLEEGITKNQINKANLIANSDLIIQLLARSERLQDLQNRVKGIGSEIYVQRPNNPQIGTRPQQKMIVLTSFFVALFVILLFILMILAWRKSAINPKQAEKIDYIRRRLGLAA